MPAGGKGNAKKTALYDVINRYGLAKILHFGNSLMKVPFVTAAGMFYHPSRCRFPGMKLLEAYTEYIRY